MKRKLVILVTTLLALSLSMEAQDPIKWTFSAVQTGKKHFEVHLKAAIDPSWHLYSQQKGDESINIATTITFLKNPMVKQVDSTGEQGDKITNRNHDLNVIEYYYEDQVLFITPVKVKDTKTPIALRGSVMYQACTEHKCLQPVTREFTVILEAEHQR